MGSKRSSRGKDVLHELEEHDHGSEDDDFKPRRTSRSRNAQQKVGDRTVHKTSRSKVTDVKEGNKVDSIHEEKQKKLKKDSEVVEDDNPRKRNKVSSVPLSNFCPICQVPLNILKISAATHTAACSVSEDSKECPQGSLCLNSNMFHYRDFSHAKLAAYRVSEEYFEPDIIFTPKKSKPKHSPLKNSSGKKRLSKSPITSPATKISRKEPETPKSTSSEGKSKQLFCENANKVELKDDGVRQIGKKENILPGANKEESEIVYSQNGQDERYKHSGEVSGPNSDDGGGHSEDLVQSSLWCSDLILSQGSEMEDARNLKFCGARSDASLQIKNEPQSPSGTEENLASNANVIIHYDNTRLKEKEQNLISNQIVCSQDCTVVSESSDVLRANCSVVIKATGIDKKEAMAQIPLSVTLAVNSTGWEAVEIKGNLNTLVQKIDVSLCQCSHLMNIECCVNNGNVSTDSLLNSHEAHEEKFFSTMGDLGLKAQNSVKALITNEAQRKSLLQGCSQITISPFEVETKSENIEENRAAQEQPSSSVTSSSSEPSGRIVNAFSLLKSASSKVSDSSRTSGRSTPTPVPMVVSKATGSSWTLVPGERNYNSTNKKVPAYKKIPDTPFVVDAFNYGVIPGVKIYFLSHFHSDHFMGLRKNFNLPIFCSQITANLVNLQIRVDNQYLHILKIGEPRVVCGVEVEVYDANHCPGAIMFLFRLLDGRVFLHVGDFRAHPNMEEFPQLRQVDKLYLDTTYCDPAYDFPYQEDVVDKVVETVRGHLDKNKSCLIVCGTYTIGKEKVFIGIAEAFNFKIWCTAEKRRIYKCLEDQVLLGRLTTDPLAAQVHVLAMRDITIEVLEQYISKVGKKYSHVVGFKPTGWTTSKSMSGRRTDFQRSSRGKVTIYGVPYSEHSSFSELRRFVRYVRPRDIQVTVNVSKSAEYKKLFAKWLSSDNDNNGQAKVLQYFSSTKK